MAWHWYHIVPVVFLAPVGRVGVGWQQKRNKINSIFVAWCWHCINISSKLLKIEQRGLAFAPAEAAAVATVEVLAPFMALAVLTRLVQLPDEMVIQIGVQVCQLSQCYALLL
jgi:hypothetical protein